MIKNPASEFIPSCYRRVLHADPLIVDARDNAPSQRRPLRMSYAQSFLKEEVGMMYRGELIIRGNPDIEPFDIVLLTDEATGLHGPIEVESITHLFNQEMGFVSVIVPRAMIMMNESATADLIQAFWMGIHNAQGIFNQVSHMVGEGAAMAGASVGISGAITGLSAGMLFGGPARWITAAVTAGGIMWMLAKNRDLNPIFVSPLQKFGRSWMGGLEGYRGSGLMFRTPISSLVHRNLGSRLFAAGLSPSRFAARPEVGNSQRAYNDAVANAVRQWSILKGLWAAAVGSASLRPLRVRNDSTMSVS